MDWEKIASLPTGRFELGDLKGELQEFIVNQRHTSGRPPGPRNIKVVRFQFFPDWNKSAAKLAQKWGGVTRRPSCYATRVECMDKKTIIYV